MNFLSDISYFIERYEKTKKIKSVFHYWIASNVAKEFDA